MKRVILSALLAAPFLLTGCNAGPLDETETGAEQVMAAEQPITVLYGSGVLYDSGHGRITYLVENTGDTSKAQFVLRTVSSITWWKSLELFPLVNGNKINSISRIETKDGVHVATTEYRATSDLPSNYRLEFWKAGAFNFGVFVTSIDMDQFTTKGKRITFTWERD